MAKKNSVTIKRWLLQNFFAIAAVIVAFANVWIASKLAPIARDIDIIRGKVLANEERIGNSEITYKDIKKEIWEELKYIRGRVDTINNYLMK